MLRHKRARATTVPLSDGVAGTGKCRWVVKPAGTPNETATEYLSGRFVWGGVGLLADSRLGRRKDRTPLWVACFVRCKREI